jgi:hypothetical protein
MQPFENGLIIIKMDIIDTEKIMMSEHGGLPRCNKTTCISADMGFVEY